MINYILKSIRTKAAISRLCIIYILILCLIFPLASCGNKPLSRTVFALDTVITITLYDGSEKQLDGAVDLVNKFDKMFSCRSTDSELWALNNAGGKPFAVSSDLLDVIQKGMAYGSKTDGLFDITVEPLSTLWNFKGTNLPDSSQLKSATALVNYKNIELSGNQITLKNGAKIDLGGIAKGYISDRIVNYLTNQGIKSALINLGGNIVVIGKKEGRDFSIGIKKPFTDELSAVVKASDLSVVTSGTYERYIQKDGIIYHHILDPKTGMPVQNELDSVTIICKNGADADALSTSCFLMGTEKAIAFLKTIPNTEAVFINKNGELTLTDGLIKKQTNNETQILLK